MEFSSLETVFLKSEPNQDFIEESEAFPEYDSLTDQDDKGDLNITIAKEFISKSLVSDKPFKCGMCGHCARDDKQLQAHMKLHQIKRVHQCHICQKTFAFVRDLNRHILQHTEEKSSSTCQICKKECFTDEDLIEHVRIHTKEKPFKCKLCIRTFTHDFYLRIHERSHFSKLNYKEMNKVPEGSREYFCDEPGAFGKVFQCEECKKCFASEAFLKSHQELHQRTTETSIKEEITITPETDTLYSQYALSSLHAPEETDTNWDIGQCKVTVPDETTNVSPCFDCRICHKRFGELLLLQLHEKMHENGEIESLNNGGSTTCLICSKVSSNLNELFEHIKSSHPYNSMMDKKIEGTREMVKGKEKIMYKCNICSKSFPLPSKLKMHLMTHSGEKPFQCQTCSKHFRTAGSLKDHSMTHLEEKPFKCTICDKGFTKSPALEDHLRKHTGEKPFDCNMCHKKFTTVTILNQHLLGHSKEKPFKCDVCGKSFIFLCNLKNHMFTHTGERPFHCEICQRGFTLNSSLKVHMMEHTGDKPHKCSACSKSFTTVGSLKKHERVHTKEKPYSCKLCNKTFSQSSSLSRHMDVHTGQKPFTCKLCEKSFTSSSYLNIHVRSHTNQKPYQCDICLKKINVASHYHKHMASHKKNRKQMCSVCGLSFSKIDDLKMHIVVHYNKEEADEYNYDVLDGMNGPIKEEKMEEEEDLV